MASTTSTRTSAMVLLLLAAACSLGTALAASDAFLPAPAAALGGAIKDSNNIVIGTCRSDDTLLHAETVRLSSKWLQIRHQIVSYPLQGQAPGLISCVQLVALKTTNIGSAIIQSGGPGQRAASIKVKSDRGHSVSWNVLIYGR